jgi:hypothetical protein
MAQLARSLSRGHFSEETVKTVDVAQRVFGHLAKAR